MRLRSSCFSFAVSKAGLQDFTVLRHVGVMCNDRVDLKEAMVSPTLCPPHRSGDSDVTDVSAATDGIVNQMPLFRSGVHPCCLVHVVMPKRC